MASREGSCGIEKALWKAFPLISEENTCLKEDGKAIMFQRAWLECGNRRKR